MYSKQTIFVAILNKEFFSENGSYLTVSFGTRFSLPAWRHLVIFFAVALTSVG